MKINFDEILNNEKLNKLRVIIIAGDNDFFNNIVVDSMREYCRPEKGFVDYDLLSEFGKEDDTESIDNGFVVDFSTFMSIVSTRNLNGTWYCKEDITALSKKQIEELDKYIVRPSEYGRLVIVSREYKDYVKFLKSKEVRNSGDVGIISTKFPRKSTLEEIVKKCFLDRGIVIDNKSADLFVRRMSQSYDKYRDIIDKISEQCKLNAKSDIKYEEMVKFMKGINEYCLDDLIEHIVTPISNGTMNKKKIYLILNEMEQEYTPKGLQKLLSSRIDEFIRFRMLINSGVIPVNIKYSMKDIEMVLPKEDPVLKYNEIRFKKTAYIASLTSMKDWMTMKMMVNNIRSEDEASFERVLYSLITRHAETQDRLENNIGLKNTLSENIDKLNKVKYIDKVE